jgi:hypothetical protein
VSYGNIVLAGAAVQDLLSVLAYLSFFCCCRGVLNGLSRDLDCGSRLALLGKERLDADPTGIALVQ